MKLLDLAASPRGVRDGQAEGDVAVFLRAATIGAMVGGFIAATALQRRRRAADDASAGGTAGDGTEPRASAAAEPTARAAEPGVSAAAPAAASAADPKVPVQPMTDPSSGRPVHRPKRPWRRP